MSYKEMEFSFYGIYRCVGDIGAADKIKTALTGKSNSKQYTHIYRQQKKKTKFVDWICCCRRYIYIYVDK